VGRVRVLFTGGGGAGTEALWDLLGDRHEVHFADADSRRIHPVVPRSNAHGIPFASQPNFVDFLEALCRELDIDLLVPGVDEELEQLAFRREEFGPTVILLPTAGFTETMLDKLDFADALGAAGVDVPRTQSFDDPEPWSTFPCIVKPRRGRGSRGVTVVDDANELAAMRSATADRGNEYVVQELVEGVEYSVQVVADREERLRAVFPARIITKRGITISAVGEQDQAVIDACGHIHRSLPTSGCYNVQGILDGERRFMPFEINPRVSTTLCLAVASGIDPLEIFIRPPEGPGLIAFEAGIGLERFWHNAFTRPTAD